MTDIRTQDPSSEEDIRALLSVAGPRRQPPAEMEARVRAATMAAVESLPEAQASSWWSLPRAAIAATMVRGALAGFFLIPSAEIRPAGTIAFTSGAYTVRGSDAAGDALAREGAGGHG